MAKQGSRQKEQRVEWCEQETERRELSAGSILVTPLSVRAAVFVRTVLSSHHRICLWIIGARLEFATDLSSSLAKPDNFARFAAPLLCLLCAGCYGITGLLKMFGERRNYQWNRGMRSKLTVWKKEGEEICVHGNCKKIVLIWFIPCITDLSITWISESTV